MFKHVTRLVIVLILMLVVTVWTPLRASHLSFETGDVFVSLETGPVQWWLPDGTFRSVLVPNVPGVGEGMAFDASGNLYVARWRADTMGLSGNTVEKFNVLGQSMGAVGHGYNCDPHTLVFDAAGIAYVGQAGCRRSVLKFVPGEIDPQELLPESEIQGIFWLDLASDGCTMVYTSYGPNVKRFDVCAGLQLPDFNAGVLPGPFVQDLRVLADGGVLVSNGDRILRLDASGAVAQTYYGFFTESRLYVGLDLVEDGTFWVANYYTSTVYRIDLATGDIVDSFNTGTPPNTVVGVRVMR